MRLSFTGDIMCELPSLKKAKYGDKYSFKNIFDGLQLTFIKTDYLVGNLETVFAGERSGYSRDIYSYNTPDSFVDILKEIGFDFLSTANNHCLDRGIDGLKRTLDILDQREIDHTGTFRTLNERNRPSIIDILGIKIGFMAYTYGSNFGINKYRLDTKDAVLVNFFTTQEWKAEHRDGIYNYIKDNCLRRETRVMLMKKFGRVYNSPRIDNMQLEEINRQIYSDIKAIKNKCDYVVMLMHSGGQFNKFPGKYTTQLSQKLLDAGIDFIIGNHPHVTQSVNKINNKIIAYSLGNFYISPDTVYLLNENLPLYSIVLHIDIDKIIKEINVSFSIIKIINKNGNEVVWDTYELYKNLFDKNEKNFLWMDCEKIYSRVTGKCPSNFILEKEYVI